MQKVKKILAALQQHLKIKNYQLLAEYFDINKTTVYSWVKNDNIANTGKILAKCPYLNIEWLETGDGPMLSTDQTPPRSADQTLTGTSSIIAGRSIIGNGQSVNVAQNDSLVLDVDELQLILLSRDVGGKMMVRKFINELEKLKKHIEEQT